MRTAVLHLSIDGEDDDEEEKAEEEEEEEEEEEADNFAIKKTTQEQGN
ncbi:unnamed protein product [Schistocephalus solidus]|uniref:Uncharacterized protein n=1 Tax=Schistocephalus solidus TaxID=70667 RepID=A0A183SM77_SCHSO|nr:unnamed protein product [Schistocephalus solidus]